MSEGDGNAFKEGTAVLLLSSFHWWCSSGKGKCQQIPRGPIQPYFVTVPSRILKIIYTAAVERILTISIMPWFCSSTIQDHIALIRAAERYVN